MYIGMFFHVFPRQVSLRLYVYRLRFFTMCLGDEELLQETVDCCGGKQSELKGNNSNAVVFTV